MFFSHLLYFPKLQLPSFDGEQLFDQLNGLEWVLLVTYGLKTSGLRLDVNSSFLPPLSPLSLPHTLLSLTQLA